MKFFIYEDASGEWRWKLVAANGRIVADGSEGYSSESNAKRAVDMIQNFGDSLGSAPVSMTAFPKLSKLRRGSNRSEKAGTFGLMLVLMASVSKKGAKRGRK